MQTPSDQPGTARTLSSAHSDALLARASKLHDAAFADPALKKKPSWELSLALAEEELAADGQPSLPPTPAPQN